jgi:hypothetical protein
VEMTPNFFQGHSKFGFLPAKMEVNVINSYRIHKISQKLEHIKDPTYYYIADLPHFTK